MFKKILVPVDLGQKSSWEKALPVAVSLAQKDDAELLVMTVIPDFGSALVGSFFPADHSEKAQAEARVELDRLVEREMPGEVRVSTLVGFGTIYKRILKAAGDGNADLIVLSSHRPEMQDYLLGPNAARVVRHAQQSVFVVRD